MFRPGLFEGRVAIVTGGGSGIGLATARELAFLGASVAIGSRDAEKLARGSETLRADGVPDHRFFTQRLDIRDVESVAAFCDAAGSALGPVDVLVNNAGGQFPSPAESMTPKGWEAVIRNNLNGSFFMTHAVATRFMLPRSTGRIVMVTAGVSRGFPGMSHTGAARAGVENLVQSLAVEWAPRGVRINALAPGNNIKTSGTKQYGDAMLDLARKATPIKRLGTAEEIARAIVFLASFENDFLTGSILRVDGGMGLWGDVWPIADP